MVDDEISFTRLLKLNLEQTDEYEVRVENWAEDALAAAREFRPDLVLLDVVMPRMVGGDVAARLRADDNLKTTPIVFFSAAVGRKWVLEHDGIVGNFPFIAKPASVEEVIDRIEQYLIEASSVDCCRPRATSDSSLFGEEAANHLARPNNQRSESLGAVALNYS